MPFRPPFYAPLPTYRPYHVAAAVTKAAAGMLLDATSATAVGAAGSATITLTLVDGDIGAVQVGDLLIVDVGAACEAAPVTAINAAAKTVTATFAQTHSGTYPVRLTRGTYYGGVQFNQAGTSMTLTLYNGHPDLGGAAIAVITPPTSAGSVTNGGACDKGLFFTYAGTTPGDITLFALPALM